jgi:hypothetical protein
MVINIVAKDQSDINKIVKPFYWKYPTFKWVSFRDLRGFSKEGFANALREAAATIWIDIDSSFGYSAIEAMKSGSITMVKVPTTTLDWAEDENGELPNCCVWFNDYDTLHKQIASDVRSWITDKIPTVLAEETKKVTEEMTEENTKADILNYVASLLDKRKKEMEELMLSIKAQKEEEK